MRRIISIIMALALLPFYPAKAVSAEEQAQALQPIKVLVNDKEVRFVDQPQIIGGQIMVSAAEVLKALGFEVSEEKEGDRAKKVLANNARYNLTIEFNEKVEFNEIVVTDKADNNKMFKLNAKDYIADLKPSVSNLLSDSKKSILIEIENLLRRLGYFERYYPEKRTLIVSSAADAGKKYQISEYDKEIINFLSQYLTIFSFSDRFATGRKNITIEESFSYELEAAKKKRTSMENTW
jgi:hypothetical protein